QRTPRDGGHRDRDHRAVDQPAGQRRSLEQQAARRPDQQGFGGGQNIGAGGTGKGHRGGLVWPAVMANLTHADKSAVAAASDRPGADRSVRHPRLRRATTGTISRMTGSATARHHIALLGPLRQADRNFLRSLPCSPLASACFEQSSEAALLAGFAAAVGAAGAIFAAGGEAGAGVEVYCASAAPVNSVIANAPARHSEDIVLMASPHGVCMRV